jgi:hypothetical protein
MNKLIAYYLEHEWINSVTFVSVKCTYLLVITHRLQVAMAAQKTKISLPLGRSFVTGTFRGGGAR